MTVIDFPKYSPTNNVPTIPLDYINIIYYFE
jgi:hypothetical protein